MFSFNILIILGTVFVTLLLILNQVATTEAQSVLSLLSTFTAFIRHSSNLRCNRAPNRTVTSRLQDPVSLAQNSQSISSRSPSGGLVSRSVEPGDTCAIQGLISTLVGHTIFFTGGTFKTVGAGDNVSEWSSASVLYSIDLSNNFPVETLLSPTFMQNSTVPSDIVPNLINQTEETYNGALFATNDTFYVYGGANPAQNLLASYNTTAKTWSPVPVSGNNFLANARYKGQSVSDPASGLSFYAGGKGGIPGIVKFDASNPAAISWTNETVNTTGNGESPPNRYGGGMVYLPKGKAGIILSLGGSNPATSYTTDDPLDMFSFGLIDVYDVESNIWYAVKATGTPNIPNGRAEFCLGLSRAPDDSSFQVTLYGGSLENTTYYDDVWVLSIPSFQWISINDTNNRDRINAGPDAGRKGHTCTTWEESQMIVVGGIYEVTASKRINGKNSCDTTHAPIRLLDTSTYTWKSQYTPGNTYKIPSVITDIIGGDSSGKSNLTSPLGGWSHPELADIFTQTLVRSQNSTSTINPASSTPKPTVGQSNSSKSSKSSTGAIAGGVVGGVGAGIAIIIAALLYRNRRRKSGASHVRDPELQGDHPAANGTHKSELDGRVVPELPSSSVHHHEIMGGEIQELPTNR